MNIVPVAQILGAAGLRAPQLQALTADVHPYNVLLMQPVGEIDVGEAGVHNHDPGLAAQRFRTFLANGQQDAADLVITPEYAMPWAVLSDSITSGVLPDTGKLWVLGCESITLPELEELTRKMASQATFLYEVVEHNSGVFVDPLAYVFKTHSMDPSEPDRLVVLVQFKTRPMGGTNHFEADHLITGVDIYEFGADAQHHIRLLSLICSDVLGFTDADAERVYDRALIIHLQLNQNPRHGQFCAYRSQLLRFGNDDTEILCVNWAQNITQYSGARQTSWDNIGGSAWYLKSHEFDFTDNQLLPNHRIGLYYTWFFDNRAHVLFFNYEPASYSIRATKVYHHAVPLGRRSGPIVTGRRVWDIESATWNDSLTPDDGFSTEADNGGHAAAQLRALALDNPFAVERLLALSSGEFSHVDSWHALDELDSCLISRSEVIHRLTFCQDSASLGFRTQRLRRLSNLWDILSDASSLPPELYAFESGFTLAWSSGFPHQNISSTGGQHATVIYMGEDHLFDDIERKSAQVSQLLFRSSADQGIQREALQHVAIWYRENGELKLFPNAHKRFDDPDNSSPVDVAREQ